MELLFQAIPFFIVTMLLERWLLSRAPRDQAVGYTLIDTAASLAMGIGNLVVRLVVAGAVVAVDLWVWEHRLFDLQTADGGPPWTFVALFFAEDFAYYVYHRVSHEVRFFWASHVNHHSSDHYNLSTALRQSWTAPVIGLMFWLPLAALGFHPVWIGVASAISLLYQYWIHTELISTMGPFEWVFNTPSHHRVHHAVNPRYLDRNHGGILIIWDRLFGTFEAETERPTYGIRKPLGSFNPVVIAFHDFAALARDLAGATTWRARLGYLFGPPGWSEHGPDESSAAARRAAKLEG